MLVKNINTRELGELFKFGGFELIDVREPDEYDIIRIKGAKLIPGSELNVRQGEIDWDKQVIFYCRTGARSRLAANYFSNHGQEAYNLAGGISACFKDSAFNDLEIGDKDEVKNYLS